MTNITCPYCEGPMTLRTNRQTGDKFWGCLDYPGCKGTRPAGDEDREDLPSDRLRRADRERWRE